jgi:hypothetical protein
LFDHLAPVPNKEGDALYLWVKAGMFVNIQQPQALALKHTTIATG